MNNETSNILFKIMRFISVNQFRSLILVTGKYLKEYIQDIHYIWIKCSSQKRNPILWCYKSKKNQDEKSNFFGKVEKNLDKKKEFFKNININYCYYTETRKILGNTYGMCILEDFESISPNILARVIETVEGGGLIIFNIRTLNVIKNLENLSFDLYKNLKTHFFSSITSRFVKNFIFSISDCPTFLHLTEEIKDFSKKLKLIHVGDVSKIFSDSKKEEKKRLHRNLIASTTSMEPLTSLLAKTKTFDQARALLTFMEAISNKNFYSTVILTSSRGRGKSAVIGLAAAAAVSYGFGNIFVTSASPENLNCFFAFLFIGFKILNYSEGKDFEIFQNSKLKFIEKIIISVTHHQTIKFIPFEQIEGKKDQIELLIIDEAALIPFKDLERLNGRFLIFMSSTTSGYEGTGREFNLKLIENLKHNYFIENRNSKFVKKRILKEVSLEEPIRYSKGDPVENWLNCFLHLDSSYPKIIMSACPDPRICNLFLVDRNSLFSGHKIANKFLQKIMSIFASSHYRNSPDDLQILADAPSHRILVLTSPLNFSANFLPEILSALHISYEGQISRIFLEKNLINEKFISGDLLPWFISKHFQDSSFGELSGIRIIRISTNSEIQNMGYGTRAIELLKNFCKIKKKKFSKKTEPFKSISADLEKNDLVLSALLIDLEERIQPSIDYIGVSFSISIKLLCFWLKNGFSMIILKSKKENFGEQNVCIMIKLFSISNKENLYWLNFFQKEFFKEFLSLCGTDFKNLPTNIIFNIIESFNISSKKVLLKKYFSSLDLKRLFAFTDKSMVSYKTIRYLFPIISKSCLLEFLGRKILSLSESLLLISLGFQLKNFSQIYIEFKIKKYNLIQILKGIFFKFIKFL